MGALSTQPRIFVLAAVPRAALCSSAREVQPDLVKGTGIEPESAKALAPAPPSGLLNIDPRKVYDGSRARAGPETLGVEDRFPNNKEDRERVPPSSTGL